MSWGGGGEGGGRDAHGEVDCVGLIGQGSWPKPGPQPALPCASPPLTPHPRAPHLHALRPQAVVDVTHEALDEVLARGGDRDLIRELGWVVGWGVGGGVGVGGGGRGGGVRDAAWCGGGQRGTVVPPQPPGPAAAPGRSPPHLEEQPPVDDLAARGEGVVGVEGRVAWSGVGVGSAGSTPARFTPGPSACGGSAATAGPSFPPPISTLHPNLQCPLLQPPPHL
jgi:hypothetical protein